MPRKTRGETTARTVRSARGLRQEQTPAERKLWEALRGRRLGGLKFRRQHPYGNFVLDAFCVEHQLEVEVDGGIHAEAAQAAYDAARTEFLQARGIRVLRFTTEQVDKHLERVVQIIVETVQNSPPLLTRTSASGEGAGG